MTINLNVKIKSGKRTPLEVECNATSVNEKIIEFQNSEVTLSENEIAERIKRFIIFSLTQEVKTVYEPS